LFFKYGKNNMNKQKGFTLIELMVVIAIIGIIAGIAYPSYQNSISKSRRADATGVLTSFANAMERRFTETGRYTGAAGTSAAPTNTGAPWIFSAKSPIDGTTTYYNLTISAASASTYTLSAIPSGVQANDKCGTLTLTNTGVRGQASGLTTAECW
jgi:type IV pilus assembly protein PilE